MKSVNLNFLESSGPLQACNGTALPLPFTVFYELPHDDLLGIDTCSNIVCQLLNWVVFEWRFFLLLICVYTVTQRAVLEKDLATAGVYQLPPTSFRCTA